MYGQHVIEPVRQVEYCVICGRIIPLDRRKADTCRERCRRVRNAEVRRINHERKLRNKMRKKTEK